MNGGKPISSKNGGDDRTEHHMAWSILSRNNSCTMASKPAEDGKTDHKETELSRIKLSNKHLRSNFTRVENSLKSLMENNSEDSIAEQNFTKISNIN